MIIDKLQESIRNNLSSIAYKVGDVTITYRDLWKKMLYYSDLLKRQGNSPVVIYSDKKSDVFVGMLSCLLAKRPYVPIGLCTPELRLREIVELTESSLLLTDKNISIDKVDVCRLSDLEKFSRFEEKESTSDIAYIIFTSGSTGVPKGVPISRDNLDNFVTWISNLEPLENYKNINVLNQASFSFDLSVADLYYALCNGHTLVSFDFDPLSDYDGLFKVIKDNNINLAVMTPTFMKLCLMEESFNLMNYPDFLCVYFCGERLDIKLVEKIFSRFPDLKIINAYGPTEATSAVSGILITRDMLDNQILPVGRVDSFATDIDIVDDEIVLSGRSVFNGYLGGISGGYYSEDGKSFYKTGDIGYIEDGLLYCKGRKDEQIKYKGYRIELGDIEYNINKIPGVEDACVVACYDDNNSVKLLKAFVVSDREVSYIEEELKTMIPNYMIPKVIKIVEELPINKNSKIDRKELVNL